MSNTPNESQGQPGSEPQPGAWGRPATPAEQQQGAHGAAQPEPQAQAWGQPSGYSAPAAGQPAWGQPSGQAQPPAADPNATGAWPAQPAQQQGWGAPSAGSAAPSAPGTPTWDQPAAAAQPNAGWAQPQAAAPGYGSAGGYAAPGAPAGQGGYAVNYAVPAGVGGLDGATNPEDLTRPLYGATFGQAIKRFFKNYVNFNGRASRSEFWWVVLGAALLQLIPVILYYIGVGQVAAAALANSDAYGRIDGEAVAANAGGALALMGIGGTLMGLISLGLLLPMLGLYWRRLHDANFSGLLMLLSLTGIGGIVVIVLCALESKPEGRRFDPAPAYKSY
jgi:uncharacterized membrane protein YhaH (DUF805 family)